jgi:cytoskeletal protein RodZ
MMAAYDPKRPRPAELSDDPAPVDALLEPTAVPAAPAVAPAAAPEPVDTGRVAHAAAEVPVAPAPEVGTTNRAVLFAAAGVSAVVVAVLVVLRLRSRGSKGSSSS